MAYTVYATSHVITESEYEYVVEDYTNLIHFDIWEQYTINLMCDEVSKNNKISQIHFKEIYFNSDTIFKVNFCDDDNGSVVYTYNSTDIDVVVENGMCLNGTMGGIGTVVEIGEDTWSMCTWQRYASNDNENENTFITQQSLFVPFCDHVVQNGNDNALGNNINVVQPTTRYEHNAHTYFFGDNVLDYLGETGVSEYNTSKFVKFVSEFIYNNTTAFKKPELKRQVVTESSTKIVTEDTKVGSENNPRIAVYNTTGNTYLMTYTLAITDFDTLNPLLSPYTAVASSAGYNISKNGLVYTKIKNVSYGLKTFMGKNKIIIRGYQFVEDVRMYKEQYDVNWCTKDDAVTLISTDEVIPQLVAPKQDETVEYHFETPMHYPRAETYNEGKDEPKTYTMKFRYINAYRVTDITPNSKDSWVHYDNGITIERGAVLESDAPVYIHLTSQSGDSAVVNIAGTLKAPICIIR